MKKYLAILVCLPLFLAFAPHDENSQYDSANHAAPAGFGQDGPFNASNIELLSHLTLAQIGAGPANVLANDCWGWTDSQTGKEYAICGLMHATSFVDISNPRDPKYLGRVMTQTGTSSWRDMKVYQDHVFIVADGNGNHGMQVFDLTRLRDADPDNPQDFSIDAWYDEGIRSAHNVAINEASGFAYIVGSDRADGGLHIVNIQNPVNPVFAGEFADDGYTHDVAVFTYNGPDPDYAGREIAFACNEDTLTIVDVTDKQNTQMVSRNEYPEHRYSHECWLTEDQRYVYLNDELDERFYGGNTRIHVFDCLDLDNPVYLGFDTGPTGAVDHNLYINGDKLYLANYAAGMRVFQLDPDNPSEFEEIAFIDTFNADDARDFDGVWSTYPFFESGNIVISDRQNGMFVVRLAELEFEFPDGFPRSVDPAGGVAFTVQVNPGFQGTPAEDTGILHLDRGSGFEPVPMNHLGDNLYEAIFPSTPCGQVLRYYVSATSTNGIEINNPSVAPDYYYDTKSIFAESNSFEDDFETDLGWTVTEFIKDGYWERGVPAGNGMRGDPPTDADGSGACYVTLNRGGNADVDGGTSILTSPDMDAIGDGMSTTAFLNYYRWYFNSAGNNVQNDKLVVEISNDGGNNWVELEVVGPVGNEVSGGWFYRSFRISDFVQPTRNVRVRFIAADLNNGSVVEAAVDGVSIQQVYCEPFLLGDVNLDGSVNLLDVSPFVGLLQASQFQEEADANGDGAVNLLDVEPFIELLTD